MLFLSVRGENLRTLLLDSSYFPVRVINWQKAMILLISGRAEVVDEYSNIKIRSVTQSFQLPKVLRLFGMHQGSKMVRFSRYNVFWRDQLTCQYCGHQDHSTNLTFDHVIPVSRGGPTNWSNVVTCCKPCNMKKANRTPEEASIRLLKKPQRPKWTPHLCLKLKDNDPDDWLHWFPKNQNSLLSS
jgi:5-methylcytosine-specific restriction endonuclease McrA